LVLGAQRLADESNGVTLLVKNSANTCARSIGLNMEWQREIRQSQHWSRGQSLLEKVKGMLMNWSPDKQLIFL